MAVCSGDPCVGWDWGWGLQIRALFACQTFASRPKGQEATTVHATLMQPLTSGRRLGRRQDADGLIKRLHLNFCSGAFGQRWVLRRKTAGFYHVSKAGDRCRAGISPHPSKRVPGEASFADRRRRKWKISQKLGKQYRTTKVGSSATDEHVGRTTKTARRYNSRSLPPCFKRQKKNPFPSSTQI